ncbi:hypothetical protein NDA11_007765 [Ustilago hordei]|uniref:Uncharacterized protein n=1 Tax=Ustilago hordei TaxID=120017 RepID=I2FSL0_USTHO|nr:hypothetical protein NDA10_005432 [Ustilago hordei]KAJ1571093.1 hypothetical protein NDA11_007765 [Ustilago hordei]KAJ1587509.1 hypothetical protein NDA15_006241 [Ustilago hordei]KAJ1590252.1 hypothetical protein NDA12_005519 [Ustilago hordei]UTT96725.1 hypothetical protein NDA17_000815 [Ustilago hordei]
MDAITLLPPSASALFPPSKPLLTRSDQTSAVCPGLVAASLLKLTNTAFACASKTEPCPYRDARQAQDSHSGLRGMFVTCAAFAVTLSLRKVEAATR